MHAVIGACLDRVPFLFDGTAPQATGLARRGSHARCGFARISCVCERAAAPDRAVAAPNPVAAAATKPNIVLILTDDQRWDSLADMPATNARSWRRFTQSFVVEPMCCPSRASTLTGRTPSHTGVDTVRKGRALNERRTFATMLDAAGYRTVFAGKYLNKWPYRRKPYSPPGWDRFYAFRDTDKYFDYTLVENTKSVRYGIEPDDYSTDVLAGKAIHAIATTKRSEPLFVEFAPYAPHRAGVHDPTPAPRHVGACADTDFPLPANFNAYDEVSEPSWLAGEMPKDDDAIVGMRRAACEAMLAVDEAVTNIFDALAKAGRLANTYVVVTSDNGFHFGEHRLLSKGDLYEESIRVPLLVSGPGVLPGSDERLTSNIDLAPTFLDWARVKHPRGFFDGSSFAASAAGTTIADPTAVLLRGCRTGGTPTTGGAVCGSHDSNMGMNWGLRTARYKYVAYPDGSRQLFDITVDPGEVHNLAQDPSYASTVTALHQQLVMLGGDPWRSRSNPTLSGTRRTPVSLVGVTSPDRRAARAAATLASATEAIVFVDDVCGAGDRVDTEPRTRLGLPGSRAMTDPGETDEVAVDAANEVGESTAGGVGRGDTLAGVPAAPREAGVAVVADTGQEIARHAEHAAPTVGHADALQLGKQLDQGALQPVRDPRVDRR